MKKIIAILCVLSSVLIFSCGDDKTDLSGLEGEIENLKDEIGKLQSVISLQSAYHTQKKIVSATNQQINSIDCWVITFEDNTTIQLPASVVESLKLDEDTEEYLITLSDGQDYVFNAKEIVYPTGITLLTQSLAFMRGTEVMFEFRVNPSNAIFNYDLTSDDCQVLIDRIGAVKTYSYVNTPDNYHLVKIEPSTDENGKIKEGQYRAYLRDKGDLEAYKDAVALVLSSRDSKGDTINLSSSVMNVERKKNTNLPVVVIRTENEQVIADKENWIPGTMTIDGIGRFDDFEGAITIRGRGNSTWSYPKKPFAIKLDKKASVLGMPKHKRWVLLANYMDRTLIRNHIAFEIAKRTGLEWTPRGQFVEVMLNDVHLGNYYLCEQIKVDENRVNIAEMKSSDVDDESITGGYLLEMDTHYDEVNKFKSAVYDLPVMIKDPDEEVLTTKQFEYIRNFIDSTEILLSANDFAVTREYASRIADTTFIDWWIVMELAYNHEAQHPRSSYFYKDRSGVLKAGPVWDFDWGSFRSSSAFCAKEAIWYPQLFKDPVFVKKVKERWAIFKPSFEEVILLIDEKRHTLGASAELNDKLWSLKNATSINDDEHLSYIDAVGKMINNYRNRIEWLDNQIKNMR